MDIDIDNLEVRNNPEDHRFEVEIDGKLAMVEYMLNKNWITFTHTEVPPEFEGMGIASKMAKVALEYAKDNEYTVIPLCPYIKSYIHRHPEYHPITLGFR